MDKLQAVAGSVQIAERGSLTAGTKATGRSCQVAPFLRTGEVTTVLTDFEPATVPVSLVYPHTRLPSSRVRSMVDWLAEKLRRSLPGAADAQGGIVVPER